MNRKSSNMDSKDTDPILYNDGYLMLSNNVSRLHSDMLIHREGIIIICVIKGVMELDFNGNHTQVLPSDILIVTKGVYINDIVYSRDFVGSAFLAKYELIRILIDVDFDMLRRIQQFETQPIIKMNESDYERFLNYNRQLLLTLKSELRPYSRLILYRIFSAILYDLLGFVDPEMNCLHLGNMNIQNDMSDTSDANISAIRLYKGFIEILLQSPIKARCIEYYAERLCVSSKYLCTAIKMASGKTPLQWINEYVVRDICHYLFKTNLSVKEISTKMGFPSLSFFGKYVKQHTGYSPTELRKRKIEAIK